MRYCAVFWNHNFPDDPIWMAYEVDAEGGVVRLIEYFQSGNACLRSAIEEGVNNLIDIAFSFDDIDLSDLEMVAFETLQTDFERAWQAMRPRVSY